MNMPLFRQEVLDARAGKWAGSIVIVRPISWKVAAWFSLICTLALFLVLYFGEYARTIHLYGYVTSSSDGSADHVSIALQVPPTAIGFIENHQAVSIRVDAYPYQKYGVVNGTVNSHARSESDNALLIDQDGFYRVSVDLKKQAIFSEGKNHPLLKGMRVQADIQQHRQRLLSWVLPQWSSDAPK